MSGALGYDPTQVDPTAAAPGAAGVLGTPQGFAAAAMDPRVDALLGMAGGFAQAAMPSRMPTPIGAAIGMAGAGALGGVGQSLQLRQQQQQLDQATMQNQMMRARLPLMQSMISQQLGGSSTPFGAPSPMAGGGGGVGPSGSTGAPAGGGGAPMAVSPIDKYRMGEMYAALGDGRSASAMFSAASNSEGPGYSPTATGAIATPGGPADPAVLARNALIKGTIDAKTELAKNGLVQGDDGSVVPMPGFTGAKAAIAGATSSADAAGKAPYQTVTVQMLDGHGGVRNVTMSGSQAAAMFNGGGQAVDGAAPGTMAPGDWVSKVFRNESGGAANATNPNSSAAGPAQFVDGTFTSFLKAAHPQLLNGATQASLAQLKTDPQLAAEGTLWLAKQNAGTLAAGGQPVRADTLALAHNLGGAGAVDVLAAPATWPLYAIPSIAPVIAANPSMQGQTAGQYRARFLARFGALPVDLSGGAAVTGSVPTNGGGPTTTAQLPPGAVVGAPVQTPEQASISGAYGDEAKTVIANANAAPVKQQKLALLQQAATAFRTGATGQERLDAMRGMVDSMQFFGIKPSQSMIDGTAAGETIGKVGTGLGFDTARSMGSREALGIVQMAIGVNPNLKMSQGGFQVITNAMRWAAQRDQDLGAYQEAWLRDPSHGGTTAGMQAQFNAEHPPESYASHVLPLNLVPQGQLKPNTIYKNSQGATMLWTGSGFAPVPAAG